MVTVDSFLARFPKFKGFPEDIIQEVLDESELFFPEDIWDNSTVRNLAIKLLTAHKLELEQQQTLDTQDRLFAQREGNTARLRDLSNYYQLTRYGLELQDLINSQTLGIIGV